MPEFPPITEDAMRTLPRWARVALAAKCGRRVQPLLRRFWRNPHQEALKAFENAIALAELSAAQAEPVDGLRKAVQQAQIYAPSMAVSIHAPGLPTVLYAVAQTAVAAALSAKEAGEGHDDASANAAWNAYGWARHSASELGVRGTENVLSYDFSYLKDAAIKAAFTDATPVPPDSFAWEKELATYEREMPRLSQDEGKFVAIKGDQIVGVWETFEDAAHAGYEKFGLDDVLVKKIETVIN